MCYIQILQTAKLNKWVLKLSKVNSGLISFITPETATNNCTLK